VDFYISDGASAHLKNNLNILNLAHHNMDFGLDAAWTFTEIGHDQGVGDGVSAFLKFTARRAGLSKSAHLISPKNFYNFLKEHQLETVEVREQAYATVYVFYLEASDVTRIRTHVINRRTQNNSSRPVNVLWLF
jgi:hypothetical protein